MKTKMIPAREVKKELEPLIRFIKRIEEMAEKGEKVPIDNIKPIIQIVSAGFAGGLGECIFSSSNCRIDVLFGNMGPTNQP